MRSSPKYVFVTAVLQNQIFQRQISTPEYINHVLHLDTDIVCSYKKLLSGQFPGQSA